MSRSDVALITPYPAVGERHGGPSGVASYSANLAGALSDRGASVTVLAPQEPDVPREPAVAFDGSVRVERPFERGARALTRAAASAIASGAPTVHLQHELFLYGGPSSVPALMPALARIRAAGRRAVVTMHHVVEPSSVDRSFTRLHRVAAPPLAARAGLSGVQRAVSRLASAVIVHEPSFARIVGDAHVVPHGVEHPGEGDRAEARRRLGIDDRLTVLCFGFLAPYKGLEAAIAASALAGPDVRLVIAGGEHPRLAASGDRYAADLAARAPAGTTFTGRVPDEDVSAWFRAADVALFPYPRPFAASGPLALALAHHTPILLSPELADCVGAPPVTVAGRDPEQLAARLRELAADRDGLAPLREISAGLGAERAWPAVADRHLEVYGQVAA